MRQRVLLEFAVVHVYERVTGLYSELRGPADSQRWCNRHKVNLQKFYKDQTDLVEAWNEGKKMITNLIDQAVQEEKERVWVTRLVIIAIILNFVMFAGKMAAATISHSLSVTASLVDRLQPLTTLIVALLVIFTNVLVLLKFAVDSVATIIVLRAEISIVVFCG
ncbi:hypothetical protein RB195_005714 [Necator americanus]|uniref:Uncharacterized protein n=1 Tax=Necator americanus TaxID=51031 RepID=A0ABR1BP88_NECAM